MGKPERRDLGGIKQDRDNKSFYSQPKYQKSQQHTSKPIGANVTRQMALGALKGVNIVTPVTDNALVYDGAYWIASDIAGSGADNLGNHIMVQTLNAASFDVINIDRLRFVNDSGALANATETTILRNSADNFIFNTPSDTAHQWTVSNTVYADLQGSAFQIQNATGMVLNIINTLDSDTVADLTNIGEVRYQAGNDTTSDLQTYARVLGQARDVSDGSEDGTLILFVADTGTSTAYITLNGTLSNSNIAFHKNLDMNHQPIQFDATGDATIGTPPAGERRLYFSTESAAMLVIDDAGTTHNIEAAAGSGDDLGDHTATQNINLSSFDITNIDRLRFIKDSGGVNNATETTILRDSNENLQFNIPSDTSFNYSVSNSVYAQLDATALQIQNATGMALNIINDLDTDTIADLTNIGEVRWQAGNDTTSTAITYARIFAQARDVSNGSIDGTILLAVADANTVTTYITLNGTLSNSNIAFDKPLDMNQLPIHFHEEGDGDIANPASGHKVLYFSTDSAALVVKDATGTITNLEADNLGDHTATQNIFMASFDVTGVVNIDFNVAGLDIKSATAELSVHVATDQSFQLINREGLQRMTMDATDTIFKNADGGSFVIQTSDSAKNMFSLTDDTLTLDANVLLANGRLLEVQESVKIDDSAIEPTATGEIRTFGPDIVVFTGGSTKNLSDIGSGGGGGITLPVTMPVNDFGTVTTSTISLNMSETSSHVSRMILATPTTLSFTSIPSIHMQFELDVTQDGTGGFDLLFDTASAVIEGTPSVQQAASARTVLIAQTHGTTTSTSVFDIFDTALKSGSGALGHTAVSWSTFAAIATLEMASLDINEVDDIFFKDSNHKIVDTVGALSVHVATSDSFQLLNRGGLQRMTMDNTDTIFQNAGSGAFVVQTSGSATSMLSISDTQLDIDADVLLANNQLLTLNESLIFNDSGVEASSGGELRRTGKDLVYHDGTNTFNLSDIGAAADNMGDHTATTDIVMGGFNITGADEILFENSGQAIKSSSAILSLHVATNDSFQLINRNGLQRMTMDNTDTVFTNTNAGDFRIQTSGAATDLVTLTDDTLTIDADVVLANNQLLSLNESILFQDSAVIPIVNGEMRRSADAILFFVNGTTKNISDIKTAGTALEMGGAVINECDDINFEVAGMSIQVGGAAMSIRATGGEDIKIHVGSTDIIACDAEEVAFGSRIVLKSFSDATRPSAAGAGAGAVIWSSTDTKPIYSDGSNWKLFSDDSST